ncbi:hypothetical protein BpHYR1_026783 [Brachionus plicatilis]|uniref:Uncharacterized protein n=1 Tax=Brachionus plicatilis TaxID=10195 RepID=A0A3M7PIY5_BRAPC|nr:hypothetical protein BpHYR1_026783 [Brachionus plicatilis]
MVARQPEDSFSVQIQDLYPIIFDSYLNRYFSVKLCRKTKNNHFKADKEAEIVDSIATNNPVKQDSDTEIEEQQDANKQRTHFIVNDDLMFSDSFVIIIKDIYSKISEIKSMI